MRSYTARIYYGGTETEWKNLALNVSDVTVYYYTDCVHESGYWTYENGTIILTIAPTRTSRVKNPTCTEKGLDQLSCTKCTMTWDIPLETIDHILDGEHICTMCKTAATKVTLDNIASMPIQNDKTNPYSIDKDGKIVLGTVAQSYSNLTYTAQKQTQISFEYLISDATTSDRIYVLVNGKQVTSNSGNTISPRSYQIVLQEGDVLTIRYRNSGGSVEMSGSLTVQNFYVL